MSEILVSITVKNGSISAPTREVLGMARRIAGKTGDSVAAALVGANVPSLAQEVAVAGADKVYVSAHEALTEFHPSIYLRVLQTLLEKAKPNLIIFPGDEIGLDLAPRLAHRLGAGLVTDCIDVEIQDGTMIFTKPVYGGKALAKMKTHAPVSVLTVRQRTQEPYPPDEGRTAETVTVEPKIESALPETTLTKRIKEEREEVALEDAKVIVSGGRGLGGPEPFEELKKMAKLLGGAVGASRPAADEGWMPPSHQVGQTGKIVAPDLYIAIGISGSSQHLAGMSGSKVIMAINTDPEAPIFKVANLGVVEDYRNVVPTFIAELTNVLSK
jgi:electron transfer flavoprotein alpha subunit